MPLAAQLLRIAHVVILPAQMLREIVLRGLAALESFMKSMAVVTPNQHN
jgi:hypothetical protein